MKLSALVVSSLIILADAAAASRLGNSTANPNTGDGGGMSRVFVEFVPGGKTAALSAFGRLKGEVVKSFGSLDAFAVTLPTSAIDALRRDPKIALVEQDPVRWLGPVIAAPSSPLDRRRATHGQTVPYGVDMVQARDVWDANRDGIVDVGSPTGSNRMICIIDSGFLVSHEDLQGINVSGYNGNLPWNQDGDGHGTHVAGTIAAVNNHIGVVGVTPGTVNLYIVRVFGDNGGWAYSSDLIDAANRCKSAGANIISMSLGGSSYSATEEAAFNQLTLEGILSIAAAGNSGNTAFSYPASYSSVMSVAAIDSNKNVASFSQRNSQVDIAAPGVNVQSTVGSSYASYSGTSMATPHVSAVAALVWSAKPSATNEDVRSALYATAEDLGVAGRDNTYGYGLVRAKLAIDMLLTGTRMPTPPPNTSTPTSAPTQPPSVEYTVPITNLGLNKGVAKHYYMNVIAGQAVTCSTSGPNGDADLYMRFGEPAVPSSAFTGNVCVGYSATSNELCSNIVVPLATTQIYAAVHAYATFSGLTFQCTVSTPAQPSTSKPTSSAPTMPPSSAPTMPPSSNPIPSTSKPTSSPSSAPTMPPSSNPISSTSKPTLMTLTPTMLPTSQPSMPTTPLAEEYTDPITNMALGTAFAKHYYINVLSGQTTSCSISGPNGDADLYMRFGQPAVPDVSSTINACKSTSATSYDSCSITAPPEPTTVYAAVHAYSSFSDLTLECTVSTAGQPSTSKPTSVPSMMPSSTPTSSPTTLPVEAYTVPIVNLALNTLFTKHYYMNVISGQTIMCSTNGPNGDADLYLRFGQPAVPDFTVSTNACMSYLAGSVESCSITAPSASTTVYVAVHAYSSFSGLTLQCILETATPTSKPSTRRPSSTRKPTTRRPSTRKPSTTKPSTTKPV